MKRTAGNVTFELTLKKIKRINLRVRADGSVAVSAPRRTPLEQIDRFVAEHADWVQKAKQRQQNRTPQSTLPVYDDESALVVFQPVLDRLYPLVADSAPVKPVLKVRQMKSRWGSCHPTKQVITLNKQLLGKPLAALEYVVLHELVHLLHPNHQAGFHAEMARLMPDYRSRRAMLNQHNP